MKTKILILTRYSRLGASSRYRFYDFLNALEQNNFACNISPLLTDSYLIKTYAGSFRFFEVFKSYLFRFKTLLSIHKYDICLIEKELFPFVPFFIENLFLRSAKKYIVDYDDAIFHRYDEHKNTLIRYIFKKKISKIMQGSSAVFVGNDYLYQYAENNFCKNIIKIPTVVNLDKYLEQDSVNSNQFTIVWIGSQSTVRYLYEVEEPIREICQKVNGRLIVVGAKIEIPGIHLELVEWSEDSEVRYLKSADVGIMPLTKDNWDKGKCGFKIIQYMASMVPVIASPIGVNKKIISHNKNGFLANSSQEWLDCFQDIYNGIDERITRNAFKNVIQNYSINYAAPILVESLKSTLKENIDLDVVKDFGVEWAIFKNDDSKNDLQIIWEDYFNIFPWALLPSRGGVGADIGCGSGRWSIPIAGRVEKLYLIDPSSKAIKIAKKNLNNYDNIHYLNKGVDSAMPLIEKLDFAYSLGVLHHVPDINSAFSAISSNLKKGAPFLVYLYHSFDESPSWYRYLWYFTDFFRKIISKMPSKLKLAVTQLIAILIYWPVSRLGLIFGKLGFDTSHFPLIYYSEKPFYYMRNDSLDRFGTRLENRFSKKEIESIFIKAGFGNVIFSKNKPYWCACGIKL